ncbi:MAG: dihydrodipicolinate synthase family protein [Luteolibacter sp.]|uniref:dihydrodipicolinate synthase family protein n=1 Tax=Luteolibacter sp. TaxID=1962973 RepID=UPI003266D8D8
MIPLRIHGVVPPVATPLTSSGRVDEPAIHRIINHLVDGGCDGAFVLGSTGELASLNRESREIIIRESVRAAAGRIPILVGIADTCPEATLSLGRLASDLGADALVMAAPYYYDLAPDELERYFTSILPGLDRPTLLYNMPWLTGHVLGMDCLRSALEHPNVIGFKDSSGDMDYLKQMIGVAATREGTTVLVGNEYFYLEALKLGAHGAVAGGGNIYPTIFRALQDAFDRGDLDVAATLQDRITRLGERLFNITGRPTSVFCAVKAGMAAVGLCEHHMAPPLTTCTEAEMERVREILASPDAAHVQQLATAFV